VKEADFGYYYYGKAVVNHHVCNRRGKRLGLTPDYYCNYYIQLLRRLLLLTTLVCNDQWHVEL